jgi:fumarylacetoacetate (FAA) hydrolase
LSEDWGIDLEAEVAVITGDVKMGASAAQAAKSVRLLMLVNDVSLAQPDSGRAGQGFWLFPVQAGQRLQPGGGHARRTWEPTG